MTRTVVASAESLRLKLGDSCNEVEVVPADGTLNKQPAKNSKTVIRFAKNMSNLYLSA